MKERIHITAPDGRTVTVELSGDMFFIGEKMYLFHDMADLIETAKGETPDEYLSRKISEAAPQLSNIDPASFMDEVRGRETSEEQKPEQ